MPQETGRSDNPSLLPYRQVFSLLSDGMSIEAHSTTAHQPAGEGSIQCSRVLRGGPPCAGRPLVGADFVGAVEVLVRAQDELSVAGLNAAYRTGDPSPIDALNCYDDTGRGVVLAVT